MTKERVRQICNNTSWRETHGTLYFAETKERWCPICTVGNKDTGKTSLYQHHMKIMEELEKVYTCIRL